MDSKLFFLNKVNGVTENINNAFKDYLSTKTNDCSELELKSDNINDMYDELSSYDSKANRDKDRKVNKLNLGMSIFSSIGNEAIKDERLSINNKYKGYLFVNQKGDLELGKKKVDDIESLQKDFNLSKEDAGRLSFVLSQIGEEKNNSESIREIVDFIAPEEKEEKIDMKKIFGSYLNKQDIEPIEILPEGSLRLNGSNTIKSCQVYKKKGQYRYKYKERNGDKEYDLPLVYNGNLFSSCEKLLDDIYNAD